MSTRMRSSYLKPPLPKSPLRLRSRQVLSSSSSSALQTPPGLTKFQKRNVADLESNLPIEYSSISSEIHAMAKMVEKEFAQEEVKSRASAAAASSLEHMAANSEVAPLFERGRLYDEYSARRNERLRRKKGGGDDSAVKGTPYNLGVEPVTTKRRGTVKKKTATAVSMGETTTAPRYSLRSMKKENKKPPIPLNVDISAMKTVTSTRRVRRI
ncbi:hypothetical protein Bca52824_004868 [Brassica carinata]|uniref:Uncharacterized protein n=1 Tax=Brassica carinata TaxID=52824 RepID=A0A8X7WSR1_BRACI|nr:hypothetical protein Bca52824_004868 [Brassica carinata]